MKTKILSVISISLLIALLLFSTTAAAATSVLPSQKGQSKSSKAGSQIVEKVDSNVAVSPTGLQRRVYIHYKQDFVKGLRQGKDKKAAVAYRFLFRDAKWTSLPVNYVVDPDNPYGLSEEFVTNSIYQAAEEWDTHTNTELFGVYSVDHNASWDGNEPDGKSEFVFGDYPEKSVIGITVVWGYFSGAPAARRITEFDVLFDTDFKWGDATLNPALMDLQNIATHEIGHGVGLADLSRSAYAQETMYAYSNYGEVTKRDLNTGDIAGLQVLYGY